MKIEHIENLLQFLYKKVKTNQNITPLKLILPKTENGYFTFNSIQTVTKKGTPLPPSWVTSFMNVPLVLILAFGGSKENFRIRRSDSSFLQKNSHAQLVTQNLEKAKFSKTFCVASFSD